MGLHAVAVAGRRLLAEEEREDAAAIRCLADGMAEVGGSRPSGLLAGFEKMPYENLVLGPALERRSIDTAFVW